MTIERDGRPKSPVHVHVHDNASLHVHVTKPKKPLMSQPDNRTVVKGTSSAHSPGNLRRPAAVPIAGPWVPPPGKSSKNMQYSWQGPSHRLEIGQVDEPLRVSELTSEEEENEQRSRQNQHKIDNLVHEVDSLRSVVEHNQPPSALPPVSILKAGSAHQTSPDQEQEIEEYRRELSATEMENRRLRQSIEGSALNRCERQRLRNEREQLMKKLVEVEMDGQTVVKQASALGDIVRNLKRGEHLSTAGTQLVKQRQLLLQQLDTYDGTNRSLRQMLRERHDTEASCSRLADQRDVLLAKLADTESNIERLRTEVREQQQLNEELTQHITAQRVETVAISNQQSSLETTRAHLQKQLRQKEADCNRMAVQVRSLESQLAQEKSDADRLHVLLTTAKEKAERDKQALKNATRAQKHRAVRSETSMKQMGAGIAEKDAKLVEAQTELQSLASHYDKVSKEKAQALAENSASRTRVGELESIVERLEADCKLALAESAAQLQEKTAELATAKLDNERFQASLASSEQGEKQSELEKLELRKNIAQYETLVEEYRAQRNESRREADESFVQLEDQKKELDKVQQESESELDTVKSRLQARLQELEPIPELLKSTELQLQDCVDQLRMTEHRHAQQTQLVSELTAKLERQNEQLAMMRDKYHTSEDDGHNVNCKLEALERKMRDMEDRNRDLLCSISKKEEVYHLNTKQLDERTQENASLMRQLEAALLDAKRQTEANRDKMSAKDRSMQSRVLELETRLSQSRSNSTRFNREREEMERKSNRCISDLRDQLEQAESNNRALQNYVQLVKSTYSRLFGDLDLPTANKLFT